VMKRKRIMRIFQVFWNRGSFIWAQWANVFSPILHTLRYFYRLEHIATMKRFALNWYNGIWSAMEDNLMQCLSALCRMIVMVSGSAKKLSELQSWNAYSPIEETGPGIDINYRWVQSLNTQKPMEMTESGMMIGSNQEGLVYPFDTFPDGASIKVLNCNLHLF